MVIRVLSCLVVGLLLITIPAVSLAADSAEDTAANSIAVDLPPLLPDQHGELGGLQNQPEALQLVIVVSAKRLRRMKPWERELRERYPDLGLLRVADVPVSGPTPLEEVAGKLRKRLPEDIDVLIDLDSSWARHFDLDVSVPNVLLFNADRLLLAQQAGFYKRQRFEALAADIDQALAAASATTSADTL